MTGRIILSTFGSLGDLFPVLSLAQALEDLGQPTRLLLSDNDAPIARAQGLDAIALGPPEAEVLDQLGLTRDDVVAQMFKNPSPVLRDILLPQMERVTRESLPHVRGARAILGTALAFGAPLVAEITALPFVPVILQPMALYSPHAPPQLTGFSPPMVRAPKNALALGFNRLWLQVIRAEFRRRHGRDVTALRKTFGLGPSPATPLIDVSAPGPIRIGLWDPHFAPAPADAHPDLFVAGFPKALPAHPLPPELAAFLGTGTPPLCVTMGSVAQNIVRPGFYEDAIAMARRAGLRVVVLSGAAHVQNAPDVFVTEHVDHNALFPQCAAVLHHGGMGTMAVTLRTGLPHLIAPFGADQPDNAARIERLGLGMRLPRRFGRVDMAEVLRKTPACADFARTLCTDGSARAAKALLAAL